MGRKLVTALLVPKKSEVFGISLLVGEVCGMLGFMFLNVMAAIWRNSEYGTREGGWETAMLKLRTEGQVYI